MICAVHGCGTRGRLHGAVLAGGLFLGEICTEHAGAIGAEWTEIESFSSPGESYGTSRYWFVTSAPGWRFERDLGTDAPVLYAP